MKEFFLAFDIGIRVHRETMETAASSRSGRYVSDTRVSSRVDVILYPRLRGK